MPSSSTSSTNSPCAACKIQRRKCTPECIFAPYFPSDHPQKFASVHRVFGAKNVAKLLNELYASQRQDAVNSLYYEAEQRLLDPVYGCMGSICLLQHRLKQLDDDLKTARKELAHYIGPQAFLPMLQTPPPSLPLYNTLLEQRQQQRQYYQHQGVQAPPKVIPTVQIPGVGPGPSGPHYHQQQQHHHQIFEAPQFVVATNQQQQQQQQQELVRFGNTNVGYESVTTSGFNHITTNIGNGSEVSACLELGSFDNAYINQTQPQVDINPNSNQIPPQLLLLAESQQQQQQQRSDSEEGKGLL